MSADRAALRPSRRGIPSTREGFDNDVTSPELTVVRVDQTDPRAQPLLAELAVEYSSRYGGTAEQMYSELVEYPADEFAAPDGALVVIVRDDEVVAGGAFRRYDADTAELKRIWTSAAEAGAAAKPVRAAAAAAAFSAVFMSAFPSRLCEEGARRPPQSHFNFRS